MVLKLYQVDAFTGKVFGGNPAAVCPLTEWLSDEWMQKIAAENNLSETAFFVPGKEGFHIRWFTPVAEVELCGHATLAAAHVLFNHEQYTGEEIVFSCQVGILKVTREGKYLTLDFPAAVVTQSVLPGQWEEAMGKGGLEYYTSGGFGMAVYATEKEVMEIVPDFTLLKAMEELVVIVTAPGENSDFVSRVFAPRVGIEEDPVTGSAHTRLVPYWAEKLNKTKLKAIQVSDRRGELECEQKNDRILMSGEAVTYLIGEIYL